MLKNDKIGIESKKIDILNKKIDSLSKVIDSYYKQAFILIAVGGGSFYYAIKFIDKNYVGFGMLFLLASLFFGFWLSTAFMRISEVRNKILEFLKKVQK